jgi:hypothetical protein
MIGLWTANVVNNFEEKTSFEEYLRNNTRLLTRLKQIIEDKENALDKIDYSLSSYDNSNWSHKQAHINGRRAELVAFKQLLTL